MRHIRLLCATIFLISIAFIGCRKSESELGQVLFRESGNRVFKEIDPAALAPVLEKMLRENEVEYGKSITAFYHQNNYTATLIKRYLPEKGMEILLEHYQKAYEHGLDPGIFQQERLKRLLDTLQDKKAIETSAAAYRFIAELELLIAVSLLTYSNALQYGLINPPEIYKRYYIETERPDSLSIRRLFQVEDLKVYLDSIQPAGRQYKALQKALMSGTKAPDMSQEESKRILQVNLERLRWKNKPAENKYVLVNIAHFGLQVMEKGKSVLDMKVCVGKGRNMDYSDKLSQAGKNDKTDQTGRWETPQLNSLIERVQVNPVWNIPKSIASNEIIKHAAADRYYLENANIDVYKNGQKVEDSREINWEAVSKGDMPYTFKQRPGEQNALGKIKFLFKNRSSVYLHDTPAKAAFEKPVRAISHGCVRVEKPWELARALFGNSSEYELIKKEMAKKNPDARYIELPEKVPIYLTYYTCWLDEENVLQFRPDVYGLDIVLFSHLQ